MTSELSPLPLQPPLLAWSVPHRRTSFFTGRDEILGEIRRRLPTSANEPPQATRSSSIVVLQSPAGFGATEVAVEFAHRFRKSYRSVLWIRGSTAGALEASCRDALLELDLLDDDPAPADVIARLVDWLRDSPQWLLVIEGAGTLTDHALAAARTGRGSVLALESTDPGTAWLPETDKICLSPFTSAEGAALAAAWDRATENDQDRVSAWHELTHELLGSPLLLVLAASFVEKHAIAPGDLLARLPPNPVTTERLTADALKTAIDERIEQLLRLSSRRLEQEYGQVAEDVLALLAALEPHSIPRTLIERLAGSQVSGVRSFATPTAGVRSDCHSVVIELQRYGVLTTESWTDWYRVNPAVHAQLIRRSGSALGSWRERAREAARALLAERNGLGDPTAHRLLPHLSNHE